MLFTKEFYSVIDNFEKYAKQNIRIGSMGLAREPKENWNKKWYYCDGLANEAFKLFLVGYSLGRQKIKTFTKYEWECIAVITIHRICWGSIKKRFGNIAMSIFKKLSKAGFDEYEKRYEQILKGE